MRIAMIAVNQQVQIQNPRGVPHAPNPAKISFNGVQISQQFSRLPLRLDFANGVLIPRLIRDWHRLRAQEGRYPNQPTYFCVYFLQGHTQNSLWCPNFGMRKVASQSN